MTTVYHPVSVMGVLDPGEGYFDRGMWMGPGKDPDDPEFGTTFQLQNTRKCPVFIHGVRALNPSWDAIILSLGPVRGPFDASAFNLDAVPSPPGGAGYPRYPTPENPRFVHYPIGVLEPDEQMPIRACTFGSPAFHPTFSLLFFVEEWTEENLRG